MFFAFKTNNVAEFRNGGPMRFKFEEKAKVGTLYLLGVISKNDRSELLSLLEKTSSMCSELKIDISGVEKISEDNIELLTGFADRGVFQRTSPHQFKTEKEE